MIRKEIKGSPVSPSEVKELTEYRAFYDPKTSWIRLDELSNWLIGSTALIGTLGSWLSSELLPKLSGFGQHMYALAIVLVGISLACSVMARVPKLGITMANLHDLEQMKQTLIDALIWRRRIIWTAGIALAIALILAAMAPYVSMQKAENPSSLVGISYEFNHEKKVLTVKAEGGNFSPYSPLKLSVSARSEVGSSDHDLMLGSVQAVADEKGRVEATLLLPEKAYSKYSRLVAVVSWSEISERASKEQEILVVPGQVSPDKVALHDK